MWWVSPYLLTIAIAWLIAHTIKFIVNTYKKEKYRLRSHIFMSGGMPSSHSASVCAMATIIGLREGVGSAIFGFAVLFALIVMYDALKVRRSSGEQGAALVQLIKEQKSKIGLPRVAKGHTSLEVALGGLLGIAVGLVVYLYTI
jgi:acid phosphatase family membrane protein YuiD